MAMLRGANSRWVSLCWLCKPADGIAELTVGWVGREEESGDEKALLPQVLPPPPLQPEVSGGLAYTVELKLLGCC